MLKKVVLPAPFGPMIDTIDRAGTANDTSLTATRPPKALVDALEDRAVDRGSSSRPASLAPVPRASAHARASQYRSSPMPSVSSILRLRSGSRPSGLSTIIRTSMKPKIPKLTSVKVELEPEVVEVVDSPGRARPGSGGC